MKLWTTTAVLCLVIASSGFPAVAVDPAQPPDQCGKATLLAANPSAGKQLRPQPHADGKFTPVLLVHGWNGKESMWWQRIDHSILPKQPSTTRSLGYNLQELPGTAVYTLDYRGVAEKWFAEPGAGGALFTEAARCLLGKPVFDRHKMAVVAHSMGGLITRWAANTDATIQGRLGLAVTFGTPYDGSWLASVLVTLGKAATAVVSQDRRSAALLGVVHRLIVSCRGHQNVPGCEQLDYLNSFLSSANNFTVGSEALKKLSDWPAGVQVTTLTGDVIVENVAAQLFLGVAVPGDLSFGDGVVARDSAIHGDHLEKVATCRYTASSWRTMTDGLLGQFKLKAEIDQRSYMGLGEALLSVNSTCGHFGEARLIELSNEALGTVNDYLQSQDATEIVNVVAVDRSGRPMTGYTIAPGDQPVYVCDTSPAFVGTDVVSCSPSAAAADVCWVTSNRRTLLCGGAPWHRELRRVVSDSAVATTAGTQATALPWGLELATGTRCRLRNGGSWDGRADGYHGAYSCDKKHEFILVPPNDTKFVDKSSTRWTVHVGDLGNPDTHFPPPVVVAVRTAYFASSARG